MILLLLIVLGTANIKAQVRIGGDTAPNAAAVLDLNANNDATPTGNKGGLALPRVSLASTTAQLNGATPITGMLVFNTNGSMTGGNGAGLYYWDGSSWSRVHTSASAAPLTVIRILDTTVIIPNYTGIALSVFPKPLLTVADWCNTEYRPVTTGNGEFRIWLLCGGGTCIGSPQRVVCYRATQ